MYIIDESYFTRELSIPNINEILSDAKDNLRGFVDDKVRLLLQNALGYPLFKDLDTHIDANGNLGPSAPQKWKNLVNGAQYTKSGKTYKWNGLIYTQGTFKKSLLADFVYCQWLDWQETVVTGTGEKVLKATNATDVSSNHRQVNIWNRFLEQYQGAEILGDYPIIGKNHNARYIDWIGSSASSGYVPLITFLLHNATDYPNIAGKRYRINNYFGL